VGARESILEGSTLTPADASVVALHRSQHDVVDVMGTDGPRWSRPGLVDFDVPRRVSV
jgi:hypothetical protein